MRIALPVDEKNKETTVCMSYGRCPYFMVYDTEKKDYEYIDNEANSQTGGAGITAGQMIIDAGCSVVLTPRLGENAADVLYAGKVKIYKTDKSLKASANVEAYLDGKLPELSEIHSGFHGGHN